MTSIANTAELHTDTTQDIIDSFWKANLGTTQPPTRPFSVLPNNVYAKLERQKTPKGSTTGASVTASYVEAVKDCEAKVARIVAECRRNNVKYSDPHFDLDDRFFCLKSLGVGDKVPPNPDEDTDDADSDASSVVFTMDTDNVPACAKRVGVIFEKPQFFVGGPPNVRDTRQGREGDCWFISSIGSLCVDDEDRRLIERLCPAKARNEKVGVYGFVFNRDGEWFSEVIDDKLYLKCPDYDDCDDYRRHAWDSSNDKIDPSRKREGFRKAFQTGSDALFYGSCSDPNEIWVPLMEKAFAKAHGDYSSIAGGIPGEGLEDLTGGITTRIVCADVLDTDELWTEGLMNVNKLFLFGAGSNQWNAAEADNERGREGIQDGHAYSVLKAVDYKGQRLLLVKNPWGDSEWSGPWSDGSKEWTSDALRDLEYQFGDDGIFWMPYEDFLRRFVEIYRTRLFTADWKVTQRWTTVQVPWAGEYNSTKFQFTLTEPTRAVIVLSKLDDRYFEGLCGQYFFKVSFRLHVEGEDEHLVRGYSSGWRSAVAELDLEAGTYDVLIHVTGFRSKRKPKIEEIVRQNWLRRREKLLQIGLSYDLAQAKGQVDISPEQFPEPGFSVAPDAKSRSKNMPIRVVEPRNADGWETEEDSQAEGPTYGATDKEDPAPEPEPEPEPAPSEARPPSEALYRGHDDTPGAGAWNATLVVGLRVFCEASDAEIEVVTPQSLDAAQRAKEELTLDVDDPEKYIVEHHYSHQAGLEELWSRRM